VSVVKALLTEPAALPDGVAIEARSKKQEARINLLRPGPAENGCQGPPIRSILCFVALRALRGEDIFEPRINANERE